MHGASYSGDGAGALSDLRKGMIEATDWTVVQDGAGVLLF
jgi:hypothetical protein